VLILRRREDTFFKFVHKLVSRHMQPHAMPISDGAGLKVVRGVMSLDRG
jgi:hypothetical protein